MKKITFLFSLPLAFNMLLPFVSCQFQSEPEEAPVAATETAAAKIPGFMPAKVDFDAYEALLKEAKEHRKERRIDLNEFLRLSREDNSIILDTRSDAMYNSKHIKGAIHLNFSDFAQENLAAIIPSIGTRILIYCNNNFEGDQKLFISKEVKPEMVAMSEMSASLIVSKLKPVTLALNIPTYINLYGYGYRNLYELSELVDVADPRIAFEGTAVK